MEFHQLKVYQEILCNQLSEAFRKNHSLNLLFLMMKKNKKYYKPKSLLLGSKFKIFSSAMGKKC